MSTAYIVFGVVAGTATQRLTGMGFALVATPFLVLALGAWTALGVLHVAGVLVCGSLAVAMRRDVKWQRTTVLGAWALAALLPATWAASVLPARALDAVIAIGVLGALTTVVTVRDRVWHDGATTRAVMGLTCGTVTAMAGIGGPVMSVYSHVARWPHHEFAATVQPFFTVLGTGALMARFAVEGQAVPSLPRSTWLAAAVGLPVGIAVGGLLRRVVPERQAFRAMLTVAFLGTITVLLRALMGV